VRQGHSREAATVTFDPIVYKETTRTQWDDAAEAWHRWGGVLERWLGEATDLMLDLAHVGMSGHSFGAVTTQAVSGQAYVAAGSRHTDPRIDAAILFSPSSPQRGSPTGAFSGVKIPKPAAHRASGKL
jgi:hypothetical protein